jgi:hypothetical protein
MYLFVSIDIFLLPLVEARARARQALAGAHVYRRYSPTRRGGHSKLRYPKPLAILIGTLLMGIWPIGGSAQVAEPTVQAAFLYNFAKFTEWPKLGNSLVVCTTDDSPLADALDRIKSKPVQGRLLDVRRAVSDFKDCQILFVDKASSRRLASVLRAVNAAPVLTVSDLDDFIHSGGMVGLETVDNHVRFEVNLEVTKRAGLKVSAQLLKLASTLRGQ